MRLLRLIAVPVAARPATSAGIAAFAALFSVVAANALNGQAGRHAKPLIATRGASAFAAQATDAGNDDGLMPVPLVVEVQAALMETGHYRGALDGRPGRVTEAAIRAFQSDNGLKVDGTASPLLLSQIRQMTAEAPQPSAAPERQASLGERATAMNDATSAIPIPTPPQPAAADVELVRRIQAGLVAAKVAVLHPDGIVGEQTRAAIRAFETQQGLAVTGRPDQRVLKRLIAIGAVK